MRVRRNLGRAARANPAAAHTLEVRRGRASPDLGAPLPCLILAPVRSPGKEGRAGPPERRRKLNHWDAGRAHVLARQPLGASTYGELVPLAPAAPTCSDVRDSDLGAAPTVSRAAR